MMIENRSPYLNARGFLSDEFSFRIFIVEYSKKLFK
jgi:hypothetical protein